MTNIFESFESLFRKRHGRDPTQNEIHLAVDQSVRSFNQSGGITAHTVNAHTLNMAPPQRRLDDGLRAQILKMLPRDKPIDVTAIMGDAESFNLAEEIYAFVKSNGFVMKDGHISAAMYVKPVLGLEFDPVACNLIVGQNG